MTYLPHILNPLLMMAMPIVLAWYLARRLRVGWELAGAGALTFILSQVGHIPFNWLVLQRFALIPTDNLTDVRNLLPYVIFLGLSAGLFEEGARYLTYRYWMRDARAWKQGLMMGAGHGGIESLLLGLMVAMNYVALAAIDRGAVQWPIPAEQWPLVQAQIAAVFQAPWYDVMLGALERLFALCLHLAASLLVMQVLVHRQWRWLATAVLLHGSANAIALFALIYWNPYIAELALALVALLCLATIFALRAPEPEEPPPPPLPPPPTLRQELPLTPDALEKSRYT